LRSTLARAWKDDPSLNSQHKTNGNIKKRRPGGLLILHEDRDLLVVVKPAGLLTIGTDRDKTRTAHYLLNDYVRKGNPKSRNRVYVVHRLDQDTSGILLFAKSEHSKTFLQKHWNETDKYYLAIVHGQLASKEGKISSCLVENSAHNVYSTQDASQGKLSHTAYKVLQQSQDLSLLEIHLLTGRKHQIRVHFADLGHPVVGDRKYGGRDVVAKRLALHAFKISFIHPFHGSISTFESGIPEEFKRMLKQASG
jgi:tRNA pseudouridine32 synthase/23S rRNA pseudouridine746 synthase/23S rRNA pseudouridine1911/1915/1917 synthase